MNVSGISGAARVAAPITPVSPVASLPSKDAQPRAPRADALVVIDSKTQLPVPLRFPWLSRLATELENAAGQPAPFGKNPDLGDRVDTKV